MQQLSALEYDELLRLKAKTLHSETETIDYAYNIRNWISRINSNLFTQDLYYEAPIADVAPQFNGNISGMRWRTARQGTRAYAFEYDDQSRLVEV